MLRSPNPPEEGVRELGGTLGPQVEGPGFSVYSIPFDEIHRAGYPVADRQGTHGRKVLLIGHIDKCSSLAVRFKLSHDLTSDPN